MGYTVEAVFLDSSAATFQHGLPSVLLPCGLTLIPMTDGAIDGLAPTNHQPNPVLKGIFWKMTPALEKFLVTASRGGRVAYVEADYFGGTGTQAAVVFQDGSMLMAPEHADGIGPINRALHTLGVVRSAAADEFDTVGLGRHRHTSRWIEG